MAGKPILVTGSHRSGTTWVGRMIARHPGVVYVWEPFHLSHDVGECSARFELQNTYVCEENEADYLAGLQRTVALRYNLDGALARAGSRRHAYRVARGYCRFLYYRLRRARALLKDPRAVFSAEWLASRLNANVIVTIRHPLAVAGSFKVRGSTFPFDHLLRQPLLMRSHLEPFAEEIREFVAEPHHEVDQAALLWKLIHHTLSVYRERHPDWMFVRNEDLSHNPVNGFREIFARVGLDFPPRIQDEVRSHSGLPRLRGSATRQFENVRRDSAANIDTWKSRLTPDEIVRVRDRVGEVGWRFYPDDFSGSGCP